MIKYTVYFIAKFQSISQQSLEVSCLFCCDEDDSFTCSRNFVADQERNRTETNSCCPFINPVPAGDYKPLYRFRRLKSPKTAIVAVFGEYRPGLSGHSGGNVTSLVHTIIVAEISDLQCKVGLYTMRPFSASRQFRRL